MPFAVYLNIRIGTCIAFIKIIQCYTFMHALSPIDNLIDVKNVKIKIKKVKKKHL